MMFHDAFCVSEYGKCLLLKKKKWVTEKSIGTGCLWCLHRDVSDIRLFFKGKSV